MMNKYIKALIMFLAGIILVACAVFLFLISNDYSEAIQKAFIVMGIIISGTLSLPCFGMAIAFLVSDDFN